VEPTSGDTTARDPWLLTSGRLCQVFGITSMVPAPHTSAGGVPDQPLWSGTAGPWCRSDFGAAGGGGLPIMTTGPCVSVPKSRAITGKRSSAPISAVRGGASLARRAATRASRHERALQGNGLRANECQGLQSVEPAALPFDDLTTTFTITQPSRCNRMLPKTACPSKRVS
jgi:hypothetical protein